MSEEQLGFKKKSQSAGIPYFHIFDNSICQKSKVELDGWEGPIKTTNPQTKKDVLTWVIRYDYIAAYVINSDWFKKEFTKEQGGGKASGLDLTLLAGGKRAMLTLKWLSTGPDAVLKRYLKVAPNIDFEKPLLISCWKNNAGKQAVSFRQGDDPDPQKWEKVEEFWRKPVDPVTNQVDRNQPSKGADGSIMPEPEHDEFQDTWSYALQNRFLIEYYMQNIQPRIKEIYKRHAPNETVAAGDTPTHTGTPVPEVGTVTEKPANAVATNVADLATGEQRAQIRMLSKQIGFDFEARAKELLGATLDELSKEAASYAIYKLQEMIGSNGSAAPAPAPTPAPAPVDIPFGPSDVTPAPAPQAAPAMASDWGAASAPAPAPSVSNEPPDFS